MRFLSLNIVKALIVALTTCSVWSEELDQCGTCEPSNCESPRNCLAGMVKDICNCCYLCGNKEGERCYHEDIPSRGLGSCGDNLVCRVRSDLDIHDPPEAVCVCKRRTPLCGSDGKTYDNICQLTEARYVKRNGLRAVSSNPCVEAPTIVLPPQNIRNSTGKFAMMSCEVKSYPLPTITWERQVENSRVQLPGNNTSLAIQSRNDPNRDETTSWLLFLSLSKKDDGLYFCKAENDFGSVVVSATVTVI
ncbi:hypothetical protein JTE90_000053 [Oedothorax gibbosus]|uniref:Uncharacterized protein n=1 Tax=Oedothorax gibbosus TaxID=931172 RepID=A0AAV6UC53_9ARAC|nr:hypothetical protein JTE90_000053 [Oedothorax gibbosus]